MFPSNISLALAVVIVTSIIPVYSAIHLFNDKGILPFFVAISTLIIICIMIYQFLKIKSLSINKHYLLLTFVFTLILCVPLVNSALYLNSVHPLDLLSAPVKLIYFFIFFVLFSGSNKLKEDKHDFYFYFTIISTCILIGSLAFSMSQISIISSVTTSYELNIKGVFANRNQLGFFAFLTLCSAFLTRSNIGVKWIIFLSALSVFAVFVSMSRGAIISSLIFLSITFFTSKTVTFKNKLYMVLAIAFISLLLVIIFDGYIYFNRLNVLFIRTESGLSGRSEIWNIAFELLKDTNVLLGVGFYQSVEMGKSIGLSVGEYHNAYLDLLFSGGIAELLFTVISVIYINIIVYKKNRNFFRKHFSLSIAVLLLGMVESLSVFTPGFVGVIFSVFLFSAPMLIIKTGKLDFNKDIEGRI